MTKTEFAKALTFLGTAYGKEFSQSQVEVWYTFFHDTTFNSFRLASTRLISKSKFMPSIAEIKAEIALVEHPALQLTAEEAWGKVRQAMWDYGFYQAERAMETFDPLTRRTVEILGGFQRLCSADDTAWVEKDFLRSFSELSGNKVIVLSLPENQRTPAERNRIATETTKMLDVGR